MLRARATLDLVDALDAELDREPASDGGSRLLRPRSSSPWSGVLADMERTGIAADTDYLSELEAHFAGRGEGGGAGRLRGGRPRVQPRLAQAAAGDPLRASCSLPKTKRIKTGYTTDADALQGLFVQTGHPVLEHLLRHRDVAKLKSTVDGLLKSVSDDGRIHTTFFQTVAATGRLSSTDPNLQNVPIRTEEGRRIRRAFVVGAGLRQSLTHGRLQPMHLPARDILLRFGRRLLELGLFLGRQRFELLGQRFLLLAELRLDRPAHLFAAEGRDVPLDDCHTARSTSARCSGVSRSARSAKRGSGQPASSASRSLMIFPCGRSRITVNVPASWAPRLLHDGEGAAVERLSARPCSAHARCSSRMMLPPRPGSAPHDPQAEGGARPTASRACPATRARLRRPAVSKSLIGRPRHCQSIAIAVAGDAGLGAGEQTLGADQLVDERRLAGVRAPDDRDLERLALAALIVLRLVLFRRA